MTNFLDIIMAHFKYMQLLTLTFFLIVICAVLLVAITTINDSITKLEQHLTNIIGKVNIIEKFLVSPYYEIKKVPNIYENMPISDKQKEQTTKEGED